MIWPGIEKGDHVLIHSSLKRTCQTHKTTPRDILNSFLEAVGVNGTILLPLFNFDFCKGLGFDIRATKSEMGILTETARRDWKAVRTGHPIYSFAVLGAGAQELKNCNNFSGYGHDSPFAWLHFRNGKIAVLDLDEAPSMTYYHHVEEMVSAPYRYHKTFTGDYIDDWGHKNKRTYGLFVRNEGVYTQVNPMGELLWEIGVWSGDRPHKGSGLRVCNVDNLFEASAIVIRNGAAEGLLYEDCLHHSGSNELHTPTRQDADGGGWMASYSAYHGEGQEDRDSDYSGDS